MKKYRVNVNGTAYEVEIEEMTGAPAAAPAAAAPAAVAAQARLPRRAQAPRRVPPCLRAEAAAKPKLGAELSEPRRGAPLPPQVPCVRQNGYGIPGPRVPLLLEVQGLLLLLHRSYQ